MLVSACVLAIAFLIPTLRHTKVASAGREAVA